MGCFAIPLMAGIAHYALKKKIPSWKDNASHKSLSLLLLGGTVFGLVDHAWHGELFLLGKNFWSDMLLGFLITAAILGVWSLIAFSQKSSVPTPVRSTR